MQNYHKHSYYSNIFTPDSAASYEDYAKRAVELGHKVLSSVEHGWQGYYYECFELAKKYNLKFVFGVEAYWVKGREKEYLVGENKKSEEIYAKDRSNHHIVILAKNESGRQAINDVISEANISGYYFKPRLDIDLILSLPPEDVFVTTACIAFSGYDDIDDIILQFYNHFKDNFMLEVQYHNTEKQISWNKHLLELHQKYGIKLIVGMDSHYIHESEAWQRDAILEAKNMFYEDESDWYMDYPDDETTLQRFLEQGVLSKNLVKEAMDNTDIILTFDDYDDVPIFNKEIKLPTLYPEKTQEEKNTIYRNLIESKLSEYLKTIPESEHEKYRNGIKSEVDTYIDTGMTDYPLIDYAIVKDAVEHGGQITDTGRGSAVGFMTNTLCGFSKVDRFKSAIKLYPERFISKSRILENHNLPDIDLNVGNAEVFEESQIRILGRDHTYPMIAFGTLKKKAAFKLYARAKGMEFELANNISNQIGRYDEALKHAEDDERDHIRIYDFVSKEYWDYIDQSSEYWGIVSDKKKAPSAYLLYQGDIRKEIGLIKCKSESTKKEYITCVIDGAIAENYKFLKNDILTVNVVTLIDSVFKRIGIEHFDVNKLIELVTGNQEVWDLYANGFTMGMNQVEQPGTRVKCMAYKPQNVSELSAFVAAIRPGFKSMYDRFENREHFNYGIKTLDNLIQTKELPVSYIFFQEQLMTILNYAGFPMDQCYGIIKAIAKKHPEKVRPLKAKFIEGMTEKLLEEGISPKAADDYSQRIWTIVNDNCGYGFNCVSGSTKIIRAATGKYELPTIEEMYKIKNDFEYAKATGHESLRKKYKTNGYGKALSLCDDGKLRLNEIIDIYEAGIRQTYKVTTESGCYLICTDNHRFPTPSGKKRLDELNVGDLLYCKGEYTKKPFNANLTDGGFEPNYPSKGQCGFQRRKNGVSVVFVAYGKTRRKNRDSCEMCGKQYEDGERFEVHHIDFDRKHNEESNYQWLCCSCHKKIHYANGRTKRYEKGINTYLSPIVSIEPHKIEMTYDIEMASPYHTFVSESGLVTSNSSHAYCMALDSLYQAWQKATYPYEFYEVLLQFYSDKGKKDKVVALKSEMKQAFGIGEGEYKFRRDNRSFSIDKRRHVINPCLSSLKNFSQSIADQLYELRDLKCEHFTDLLLHMRQNTGIGMARIEDLIQIGYFSEFGNVNTLLHVYQSFDCLFDKAKKILKKRVAKNKVESYGLTEELVRAFCGKETDATFLMVDVYSILCELETVEFAELPSYELASYEQAIAGKTERVDTLHRGVVIITDINDKHTPFLKCHRLGSGKTQEFKIAKPIFANNPLVEGDAITILDYTTKNKNKRINGEWRKDPKEKELWVSKYRILKKSKQRKKSDR